MKRIALFPSAFHPSLGGVEELTGQLAVHFKQMGVSAMVCVNRWPRCAPALEKWNGLCVHRFPFRLPEAGFKSACSSYWSRARILASVVDVLRRFRATAVHVQCVSSNAWYACGAADLLKLPLIISVQGERTMDAAGTYLRSPLYNRILRSVLRRANRVTACSMATLQDLDAFMGGVLATKAQVIYNGVGAESFAVGPLWPHPQSYIFAMGRFVAQKGFATLLRGYAAAQHCRADLLIAGDGPEGERLRSLSGELGLGGRVHFVGRAHRGMVHALLRGAQGFVVPSLREPMGIVALEAMAAGKPLLVSAVDGLSEIAPEGEWCRQVPPGDVTALASGLDWLDGVGLQSPVRHQQEYARQFLWDKIARAYVDLYENVGVMG